MSAGRRDAGAFVERRLIVMLDGEAMGSARTEFKIGENFYSASSLVILGKRGLAEGVSLSHSPLGGSLFSGGLLQGGDKSHVLGGAQGEGASGAHEILKEFAAGVGIRQSELRLFAGPDGGGETFPGPEFSQFPEGGHRL